MTFFGFIKSYRYEHSNLNVQSEILNDQFISDFTHGYCTTIPPKGKIPYLDLPQLAILSYKGVRLLYIWWKQLFTQLSTLSVPQCHQHLVYHSVIDTQCTTVSSTLSVLQCHQHLVYHSVINTQCTTVSSAVGSAKLQQDLTNLERWTGDWLMSFNTRKIQHHSYNDFCYH